MSNPRIPQASNTVETRLAEGWSEEVQIKASEPLRNRIPAKDPVSDEAWNARLEEGWNTSK